MAKLSESHSPEGFVCPWSLGADGLKYSLLKAYRVHTGRRSGFVLPPETASCISGRGGCIVHTVTVVLFLKLLIKSMYY